MLCLVHVGSPGANQPQQNPPALRAFQDRIAEGKKERAAGHFAEALRAFEKAERAAREAHAPRGQALALVFVGVCEIRLFQYRAAVESLEISARLAHEADDKTLAGIAATDLSAIYSLLGNFALAEKKQEESIQLLSGSSRQDALVQAWLGLASLQMRQGKIPEGKQSSDRAIAIARSAKLASLEAFAWDLRGSSLVVAGQLPEAEQSLNRAYSIETELHDPALAFTLEHRAELELKQHKYQLALKDLDEAFTRADLSFRTSPQYYPIHVRGQILLGMGRESEALFEFRRAVDAANSWRRGAMPGDTSNTETVAFLHDVYQDFAHLAAELALARHDPELSRQAFEALAENRAASLREQLAFTLSRNSRLPARYFELLSQLQTTQAHITLGRNTEKDEEKLQQIRLEFGDLEDQIGLKDEFQSRTTEKNSLQNSLRHIQLRLGKNNVLLSFSLGARKSFLWVITSDEVNLYPLPAENEVIAQARAFSHTARQGQNATATGLSLSQNLFGNLKPTVWEKRDWLITADGALLSGIPFSALPELASPPGHNLPLIANHTIRLLPSELLLLSSNTTMPDKRFVGVADPIYNLADSRRVRTVTLVKTTTASSLALGRLVGSDQEIRTAARQSRIPEVDLLTGSNATSARLQNALIKSPEVLHFAVHVVSPEGQPEEAALALSLTSENIPELVTREAVAAYRVPGSLVVLSGCSSDQGRVLPSAGLIGLSRAWLLAGAAAVIVSAWPTADDSGQFFAVFYDRLQALKSGSLAWRAATALQQAQLQMQQSNGYRSLPSFWAAYSIVSKE